MTNHKLTTAQGMATCLVVLAVLGAVGYGTYQLLQTRRYYAQLAEQEREYKQTFRPRGTPVRIPEPTTEVSSAATPRHPRGDVRPFRKSEWVSKWTDRTQVEVT